SGKQKVNALQAAVKYPSEKLELINVKGETAFSQEAATDTSTAGLVRIARSIKPGEMSVQGAKPVATLQFKVVADSADGVELTVDDSASLLVRSSDNKNILGAKANNKFEL
ncbi:MAG TPA: cohesin domain-containing protein, partial [Hymenobacter sp.]